MRGLVKVPQYTGIRLLRQHHGQRAATAVTLHAHVTSCVHHSLPLRGATAHQTFDCCGGVTALDEVPGPFRQEPSSNRIGQDLPRLEW